VYRDQLEDAYMLCVKLTKLNGETLYFEGSPDSVMNLARHLLAMISAVGGAEYFSDVRLQGFMEELVRAYNALTPDAQEGEGGANPAGETEEGPKESDLQTHGAE
jgi:hypothetical protein